MSQEGIQPSQRSVGNATGSEASDENQRGLQATENSNAISARGPQESAQGSGASADGAYQKAAKLRSGASDANAQDQAPKPAKPVENPNRPKKPGDLKNQRKHIENQLSQALYYLKDLSRRLGALDRQAYRDALGRARAEIKHAQTRVERTDRRITTMQATLARQMAKIAGHLAQLKFGHTLLATSNDVRNLELFLKRKKNRQKVALYRRRKRERMRSMQAPGTPTN